MFTNTTPLAEIVVRVVAVYTALLVMVRIAGKREIGEVGPLDLLGMLLLSETVSPALTAEGSSLTAALVAAGTLLALAATIGRMTFVSRVLERLIDGTPREIITTGTINREVCRSEGITERSWGAHSASRAWRPPRRSIARPWNQTGESRW